MLLQSTQALAPKGMQLSDHDEDQWCVTLAHLWTVLQLVSRETL